MSHQQRWQPYRAPARWVEVLVTLLGLLGLGLGLAFYDQAFPSGAIDLRLARDEIARRAQAYLQAQGFRADHYEFALDFAEDDWASFYLQRALALLIPGAVWAFAHLGYVRDPFCLRGIELTLAAVFVEGLFFYKFDLTTTIMGHLAYNASLGALPLLRSSDPYFVANGVIVVVRVLLPIVPGLARGIIQRARSERHAAPSTSVQVATMRDVDALAALGDDGAAWRDGLADAASVVLGLCADGEVIGAAAGRTLVGDGAASARMERVWLAPQWRRRYIASFLVDELCARFKGAGVERVQTRVEVEDKILAPFSATQRWTPTAQVLVNRLAPSPRGGWRPRVRDLTDALSGRRK